MIDLDPRLCKMLELVFVYGETCSSIGYGMTGLDSQRDNLIWSIAEATCQNLGIALPDDAETRERIVRGLF